MNVAFRADSSADIGSGHVARCLALATALANGGDECVFVCRPAPGDSIALIEAARFTVARMPATPPVPLGAEAEADDARATRDALQAAGVERVDWLVVDHYGLGAVFETASRAVAGRIIAVDDLASRLHDCDLLVDHNLGASAEDYAALVPAGATVLAGPRFALLREQFADAAAQARDRGGSVGRLLVCFGGTDPGNETGKALTALAQLADKGIAIDVVLPDSAPHRAEVAGIAAAMPNVLLHGHVEDMASLMNSADLMLGAGGVTLLERAAVGLPSVSVRIAENQARGTRAAAEAGAALDLGPAENVTAELIAVVLRELLGDHMAVVRMAHAARAVAGAEPGSGPPIVAGMMRCLASPSDHSRLRPLREDDSARLLGWRNTDRVRFAMSNQHIVTAAEHATWFANAFADPKRRRFVYECGGVPMGFVTFRDIDQATRTCEWGFYVGEPWAPRGTGKRLGVLALDLAFGGLGMAEVRAEVLSDNVASLGFHARMGFDETGSVTGPSPDGAAEMEWRTFALTSAHWADIRADLVATYF
jgi:UDP-2,4-diacetamido-2,4,6-trideoxy-beta-L-altropyranose hydrolase/UDP-4-amino-4,6-dideoxy-N-acetyl-beta-L-altrosamine N-acetyltransferase